MKIEDETYREAERLGKEHGRNAASWVFDGNTSDTTYRTFLDGIMDGDPKVMDALPGSPLAGEWADGYTPTALFSDLGIEFDESVAVDFLMEEVCNAYEDAFARAVTDEVVATCRRHLSVKDELTKRTDGAETPGGDAW